MLKADSVTHLRFNSNFSAASKIVAETVEPSL